MEFKFISLLYSYSKCGEFCIWRTRHSQKQSDLEWNWLIHNCHGRRSKTQVPKKDQLRRAITHAQVLNFVTWGEKPVRSLNRLDAFPTTACYTHCAAPWQVWGNILSYDDAMLRNKVSAKMMIKHMVNNCYYHAFKTTCTVQSVRQVPQCDEYPLITRTARQSDRFHWWRLLGDYSFIINNSIQYLGIQ